MTGTEKRRLEIIAAVKDFATTPMRRIAKTFRTGFGASTTAINGFRKALQSTQGLLVGVFAGAAVQQGISAFSSIAVGLRDVANQAAATNTSAGSLLTLRDAAKLSGVEFENLSAAVRTWEKNLGDARQGAVTQNESLRRLGLTTEQFVGTNKDAVEQMAIVADALQNIEDSTVRSNLALKLFGEDTGAALLPILSQGGDALREFAQQQEAIGAAFTTEQIQVVSDTVREFEKLRVAFGGLLQAAVVELAPQLTRAFREIRETLLANAPAIKRALQGIAEGFGIFLGGVVKAVGLARKSFLGLQELAVAAELAVAKIAGSRTDVIKARRALNDLFKEVEENDRITNQLAQTFFNLRQQIDDAFRQPIRIEVNAPREQVSQIQKGWDEFFRGFGENVERARIRFSDFYTTGLNAANTLVDQGLSRLGDTIGDTIAKVRTAKEAFRELARSVLQDLARIIGRLITVNLVSSLFSSGAANETGNVRQGEVAQTVPLRRFERGGVVRRPTLALFGEGKASKGEAFVPLPDGRRIPVALQGNGGGGNVLNFNIAAMDGRDVARVLFDNRGTLRALWQRDLVGQQNVRQGVRSAVS